MELTRIERETIILFNEQDEFAEIETFNSKLKRRIKSIHEDRPEECEILHDGQSVKCSVPKAWIKINPPRIISDQERERLRNQLKRV